MILTDLQISILLVTAVALLCHKTVQAAIIMGSNKFYI
jgi:hypothetical protein